MESQQGPAAQAADGFAALPAGLHETGRAQTAKVPRDERLTQVDVAHKITDGAVSLGQPPQERVPREG